MKSEFLLSMGGNVERQGIRLIWVTDIFQLHSIELVIDMEMENAVTL